MLTTELLLTIVTECVCVFVFTSLSFSHITALCLPVSLYSIPYPPFIPLSQPKLQCVSPVSSFSVHSFKVRSFFFHPFLTSLSEPHWGHLHEHWCLISAYRRKKKLSFWINIADDTFSISLQQSFVTVATCVKIMIFDINSRIPLFFPLLRSLSDVPREKTRASFNHTFSCSVGLIRREGIRIQKKSVWQ